MPMRVCVCVCAKALALPFVFRVSLERVLCLSMGLPVIEARTGGCACMYASIAPCSSLLLPAFLLGACPGIAALTLHWQRDGHGRS